MPENRVYTKLWFGSAKIFTTLKIFTNLILGSNLPNRRLLSLHQGLSPRTVHLLNTLFTLPAMKET